MGKRVCLSTFVVMIAVLGFLDKAYSTTNKCCPQGSELIVTSDDSGMETKYGCTITSENNETFFGYNLDISNDSHIPNCIGMELLDFNVDGGLLSSDGCVDMYNGILHGLKCLDKPLVEVHILFKCCAEGFVYDITDRQCVDNLETPADFTNLFGNSVALFQTQVPDCATDQIFIEYQSSINQLKMIRSGLKLSAMDKDILKQGTFCIDGIIDSERNQTEADIQHDIIIRTCRPRDMCKEIPCVRRCCRNEMMLERVNKKSVCLQYGRNIKPAFYDINTPPDGVSKGYRIVEPTVYGLINGQTCKRYKLSNDDPDDVHYISHVDGALHVNNLDEPVSNNDYCVEFVNTGTVDLHTFVCFPEVKLAKFKYYATGLSISCVFLSITLICYACLPKLLNLHGKTLVCYAISLLSAYTTSAIVQFHTKTKLENCLFIAYLIYFSFLAAVCWQSIMCFDIWWTFGSIRTSHGMVKTKELRRFLLYSLYAWGVPTILTTLTFSVDYYNLVPDLWRPQLGEKNVCWFSRQNGRALLIFFLFPIGLHTLINTILFVLTTIHCSKTRNEISRMQCSNDNEAQDKKRKRKFLADKAKYIMNIKLFVIMGGSWTLEVVSTLVEIREEWWYITDFYNILIGVFIFIIFVCKPKILEALRQRIDDFLRLSRINKFSISSFSTTTGLPRKIRKGGPTTVTTQLSVASSGRIGNSASTSTLSTSNTNLNVIRKAV